MTSTNVFKSLIICLFYLIVCNCFLISVKIVKQDILSKTSSSVPIRAKTVPSNFSGPSHLSYFIGKCFTHSTDKYEYKVCPFDNITQHERVISSGAFNGVIGVWKEWSLKNQTFDALLFENGDDCGDGLERNAKMIWICNRDLNETNDRIFNISEPKKCFYEIGFATDFGCEDRHVYQYLDQQLKDKWDQIETQYFNQELTELGYKSALNELFFESGIISNKTLDLEVNDWDSVDEQNCFSKYDLLREQNQKLLKRIEFLENQMKNK